MRSIHKIVNKVVAPVAKKRGLVTAKIILEWDKIVGNEFAKWSRPLKVTFRHHKRNEGVLHLSINPSHALMITHAQDILLDKINTYFGYKAVAKVTVIQIPFSRSAAPTTKSMCKNRPALDKVSDNRLEQALHDLNVLIQHDS